MSGFVLYDVFPEPPSGVAYAVTAAAKTFNIMYSVAAQKSDEFAAEMAELDSVIPGAVTLSPETISGITTPTVAFTPQILSPAELLALQNSTADEIKQLMIDAFTSFLATYFPPGVYLQRAQAWIEQALLGGSGINQAVEDAIWQRDRSRILRDSARAEDEALTAWAGRGYPLPPGALVHQQYMIQQDARDKIAAASREAAIKSFEAELENMRFAVTKAIELRTAAIQAAGEYMRALATAPQLGSQLAISTLDAQAKMAQVTGDYYRTLIAAQEIPLRVATTNAELKMRAEEAKAKLNVDLIQARVQAALSAAQLYSTQAAAALNALNAGTSISSSDSVSTSL